MLTQYWQIDCSANTATLQVGDRTISLPLKAVSTGFTPAWCEVALAVDVPSNFDFCHETPSRSSLTIDGLKISAYFLSWSIASKRFVFRLFADRDSWRQDGDLACFTVGATINAASRQLLPENFLSPCSPELDRPLRSRHSIGLLPESLPHLES